MRKAHLAVLGLVCLLLVDVAALPAPGSVSPEAIDEEKSKEEENFMGWLSSIGGKLQGVDLANFTNPIYTNYKLRGVKATQDIKAGALILSMPGDYIISTINALASPLAPIFNENPALFSDDQVLLSLFLMYELQNVATSKWAPHLAVLPMRFHTACEYSPSELRQLEGSVVHDEILSRQALFKDEYQSLFPFVAQKYPHLLELDKCTFTAYKYARLLVQTRGFGMHVDGRTVVGIVPFGDMLNHSPKAKIAWKYDHTSNSFRMYTEEPYKAGTQIFNNYGPRSNRRLLLDFGFVVQDNPFDFVEIPAPVASGSAIEKSQLLEERGIAPGKQTFTIRLGEVPEELMFAARVARATHEEIEQYRKYMQLLPKASDGKLIPSFNSSFSLRNEIAALSWLKDTAGALLNRYRTTYEEDATVIDSNQSLDRAQFNALLVRFGEKRIYKFLEDFGSVHVSLLGYYQRYISESSLTNARLSLAGAEYMRNVMLPLHRSMLEQAFHENQKTAGENPESTSTAGSLQHS